MQHIAQNGLQPQDVGVVPGAAGGPKGLILGPLDRFIFGDWLAQASHDVHLVGAFVLTQAAYARMVAQRHGRIVLTTSA